MERSFLSDRRPQLEDYDAIDRAMLDCFSEPEQVDSMDFIATQSFHASLNDIFGQPQRGGFPYGIKIESAPRKQNSINLGMQSSSPPSAFNSQQYPSQSSLTECGLSMTSSSSDQSLCLANLIRNPSSQLLSNKMGDVPSNSNKRKLSSTMYSSETTLSEALPTKSELKSQHVIVSRERRR